MPLCVQAGCAACDYWMITADAYYNWLIAYSDPGKLSINHCDRERDRERDRDRDWYRDHDLYRDRDRDRDRDQDLTNFFEVLWQVAVQLRGKRLWGMYLRTSRS